MNVNQNPARKVGKKEPFPHERRIGQLFGPQATLEEMRHTASRICRDYLTGRWKEVSPEQLVVKRISGGLSNFLYYISLPPKNEDISETAWNSNGQADVSGRTCQAATSRTSCTPHNDENSNEVVYRALLGLNFSGGHNGNNIIHEQHNSKRKRCDSGSSVKSLSQHSTEPQEVLLRIYGQSHGEDALEAMITESVVFALLSERNFGPKLHGIFPGGRIEQYIPARALLTPELSNINISRKIAEKMGEIHSLNIPMSKEPDWLWNCMHRWRQQLLAILSRTDWHEQQGHVDFVRNFNFTTEAQWLKLIIDAGNYPVLFCHNDLQEGNILMRCDNAGTANSIHEQDNQEINHSHLSNINNDSENLSNEPDLIIIDFEYCAYNYRSFDLANHFLEWTFDYSNPQFPFFHHRKSHYPSKEQREQFIGVYLKKLHDYDDDAQVPSSNIKSVEEEIQICSMLSHLFWSLWSVVNTTSNIEFGYWEYAVTRIKEYQLLKEQFVCGGSQKD